MLDTKGGTDVAEVRLEGVTKIFRGGGSRWLPSGRGVRSALRDYQDRAFIERVAASEVAVGKQEGPVHALDNLSSPSAMRPWPSCRPIGVRQSTLLRVVSLESVGEGLVFDDRVGEVGPKDRGVGMVSRAALCPPLRRGQPQVLFHITPTEEMMGASHHLES